MRRLGFILFVFLLAINVSGQINRYGSVLPSYFSPEDYKGNSRNYAVLVNEKTGVLYVANSNGSIMIYDGRIWKKLYLNNKSLVYSLAQDSSGIVYVGGKDEFGYIQLDKTGDYVYKSISDSVVKKYGINNQNIWKIYYYNNKVYYCTLKNIIEYDLNKGEFKKFSLPKNNFLTFLNNRNGDIYTGNYNQGLLKLEGDTVKQVINGEYFKGVDIFSIVPYSSNKLLISYKKDKPDENGIINYVVTYNINTGKITQLNFHTSNGIDLTNEFGKYWIYDITPLSDGLFMFSTLGNGGYIIDENGTVIEEYSTKFGFKDDVFINAYFNHRNKDIWVVTDNGLYLLNSSMPVRKYDENYSLTKSVSQIIKFDNKDIYLLFISGFLNFDYENIYPKLETKYETNGATILTAFPVLLHNYKGVLLGGTRLLTFWQKDKIKPISNNYIVYTIAQDSKDSSKFYIGYERGLSIAKVDSNGNWKIKDAYNFGNVQSLFVDKKYLWVVVLSKGLYKVDLETGKYEHYLPGKNGLPEDLGFYLGKWNGNLIVGSSNGLLKYDRGKDYFYPVNISKTVIDKEPINYINTISSDVLWIVKKQQVLRLEKQGNTILLLPPTVNLLPKMSINNILEDTSNGYALIAGSKGVYSILLPNENDKYLKNLLLFDTVRVYHPFIKMSLLQSDSVLFNGMFYNTKIVGTDTMLIPTNNQNKNFNFVFPFKFRSFTFTFSYPQYTGKVEYSYFLKGFSNNWSSWTNNNQAVFTNLKEGDYTLLVKARDIFGVESQVEKLQFTILAPWYKTVWAYLAYVIITIFLVILIVKVYTRKLERDKKRLEKIVQERTAEIAKKNKRLEELVEEVTEQKKIIEEKNKDITDSIRYAEQIQVAVLPNNYEGLENEVELFVYFKPKDIVSGDFYFVKYLRILDVLVAAAVDCTGHGVPGAFMSLLGVTFLNDIFGRRQLYHSNEVLDELRNRVIRALNQEKEAEEEDKKKDGMDIALVEYYVKKKHLEFSGANNPLYLVRKRGEIVPEGYKRVLDESDFDNVLYEFAADRQPVGFSYNQHPFSRIDLDLISGDIIYLFSDGFADQFGGPKGKKYTYKRFKRLFLSIANLPMNEQQKILDKERQRWISQAGEEQIDDQLVIGIKIL